MERAKEIYDVKIAAVVTDNAENMKSMTKMIQQAENLVQYGCSAHQLNLLARDVVSNPVVRRVVKIAKVFRNCQQPRAWLEEQNLMKPQVPCAVRWNSSVGVLEWFVNGWQKLRKMVESHQTYFNGQGKATARLVKDITLFQQAEEALQCLKPITTALDAMQSDSVTIADGVDIWKSLLDKFRSVEKREWLSFAETRYIKAVDDVWFTANVLHPKYGGKALTKCELKRSIGFIKEILHLEDFISFLGGENVKFVAEFNNLTDVTK